MLLATWDIDSKDKVVGKRWQRKRINHLSPRRSTRKLTGSLGAVNYLRERIARSGFPFFIKTPYTVYCRYNYAELVSVNKPISLRLAAVTKKSSAVPHLNIVVEELMASQAFSICAG